MEECSEEEQAYLERIITQLQLLQNLHKNNASFNQDSSNFYLPEIYGLADSYFLNLIESEEFRENFFNQQIAPDIEKELSCQLNNVKEIFTSRVNLDENEARVRERLQTNIDTLKKLLESMPKEQRLMPLENKYDVIERNLKKRFAAEKQELKEVISNLMPDNQNLQNLLADIISHYFAKDKKDDYYVAENTNEISENLSFLLETKLFETHPTDSFKIRLIPFE